MPAAASKDPRETAIGRKLLGRRRQKWLVTGAAGFIGSHLVENLLLLEQKVIGLDNLSSGRHRLKEIRRNIGDRAWKKFDFIRGDIRDVRTLERCCPGVNVILHHAAIVGVPLSFDQPRLVHDVNVTGFLNVLSAAGAAGVRRIVYASSSAIYGNEPLLPKRESMPTSPISPYGMTKVANEIYANVIGRAGGISCVGLRYFNVFGERQDPTGDYASVIPRWILALMTGNRPVIYGDDSRTRDFCHVSNVVRANLLAASTSRIALNQVYNIGSGRATTLRQLFITLQRTLAFRWPGVSDIKPQYLSERRGDIRHSRAAIEKAEKMLGYRPTESLRDGIARTCDWFVQHQR